MAVRFGTIALVGRPNAGKSSLLNALVGERVAAVSSRPQTTRNRICGIVTTETLQAVLVDTPGLHEGWNVLNKRMVAVAEAALDSCDTVAWIVDCTRPFDAEFAGRLAPRKPVVVLNKIDLVDKLALLPLIQLYAAAGEVVPVSAAKRDGLPQLMAVWEARLPEGERLYSPDQYTDQTEKALCAEIIREQVFHRTGEEVPYCSAVEIEGFNETEREAGKVHIHARIVVEKPSQKAILIGKGGAMVKQIGTESRSRIERLLGCRVRLDLFIAVEKDWTSNPNKLREFGYD